MSLTYQVGCSVEAVSPVVRIITGEAALSVDGVGRDDAEEMIFAPLSIPADRAISALARGELSVVRLRFAADPARWLMVFAPWVDGFQTRWTVTYEQHPLDEDVAFQQIEREGVEYVAVTEDSLDLPASVAQEGFPWDDWQLVFAIIRDPLSNQLISRRGAAFDRWRVPS
jgi:DNA-binding transcriptional LysR family regulator